MIHPDKLSKKARFHGDEVLTRLAHEFDTTLDKGHVKVCEARKSVYFLNVGKLDSLACFINERPSVSMMKIAPSWNSIAIPNGFVCVLVAEKNVWVAETRVRNNVLEFRYTQGALYKKGDPGNEEDWKYCTSDAFRQVYDRTHPGTQRIKRVNGKLLIGCHYENPQRVFRAFFSNPETHVEMSEEIKKYTLRWLSNECINASSPPPPKRVRLSPSKPKTAQPLAAVELTTPRHFTIQVNELAEWTTANLEDTINIKPERRKGVMFFIMFAIPRDPAILLNAIEIREIVHNYTQRILSWKGYPCVTTRDIQAVMKLSGNDAGCSITDFMATLKRLNETMCGLLVQMKSTTKGGDDAKENETKKEEDAITAYVRKRLDPYLSQVPDDIYSPVVLSELFLVLFHLPLCPESGTFLLRNTGQPFVVPSSSTLPKPTPTTTAAAIKV